MIMHVREEYDTVLESVLKTEFLTLLSEKYNHLTRTTLSFTFSRRSVCVNQRFSARQISRLIKNSLVNHCEELAKAAPVLKL